MPADGGGQSVPLSLFSGLVTELSVPDIPEGLSPDNQDVIFLPGSVQSRPGLHRVYGTAISGGVTITYQKTFIQPNLQPLNLILDSSGNLWKEDVVNAPGALTLVSNLAIGSYAESCTAFNREYMAISDGIVGVGVPLQYDGTNLDRVTQDGPGQGPTLSNVTHPNATIAGTAPVTVNIAASATGITGGEVEIISKILYYTSIVITTTTPHGANVGDIVTIAGSTSTPSVVGTHTVSAVDSTTQFEIPVFVRTSSFTAGGGGTVGDAALSGNSLTRASNVVTASTSAAHGFLVGWQVQISGITNTTIGGGIASISRDLNSNVTVTTSTAHGLPVGATIFITGVTNPDTSYNGTFQVATVVSPTVFTYVQGGTVTASTGATGNVQDIWDGTFFIQSVPTTTSFTYAQLGPDDATNDSGIASVIGQVSPGNHGCVLMFLTRQGYLTAPSPPVQFAANGSQQIGVSNIAIGPSNVVARVLAFTGAGGGNYFTLLTTPIANGMAVGTALIIPDNTSTSTIVDFADNTLFGGLGIDIPGRNQFAQVVLSPCIGFFSYASRLFPWGEFTKIQNFLNMGLDGGYVIPQQPAGWTTSSNGLVTAGAWSSSLSWQITGDGTNNPQYEISQPAYQDINGIPILAPNMLYGFRLWATTTSGSGGVTADFYSPTVGVLASAPVSVAAMTPNGGFVSVNFNAPTPASIPSDTILRVYGLGIGVSLLVTIDELEIFPVQQPLRNNLMRGSYINAPEQFDGVTGDIGPSSDPTPLRSLFEIRGSLYMNTGNGKHETSDNATGEPSTWLVREISQSSGALSIKASDPGKTGTGDTGEQWQMTAARGGLYLFSGGEDIKVSQEIQTLWDSINFDVAQTIWVKNDVVSRRCYVGVPIDAATAPNVILVLDYRELNDATSIGSTAPFRQSFNGRMIASEICRKWTIWNIASNSAEIMRKPANVEQFTLGAGNGLTPVAGAPGGTGTGFGNIYYLDPAKLTDDDYGQIVPYWVSYFFVSNDQEQQFQLGSHRKMATYFSAFISGVGTTSITPLSDTLANAFPALAGYPLSTSQNHDYEWDIWVTGERIAMKIGSVPLAGQTDNSFNLQKLVMTLKPDPWAPLRGSL